MNSKKIIITGIYGFVGRNLSEYLSNNLKNKIFGVEQRGCVIQSGTSKLYYWDELDIIKEGECIIHLAGLAHDTNNKNKTEDYYRVNTCLTKTIYDFFLNSTAKTFIFFSTVKAVADISEVPLIETVIPEPKSIYGKSKLKAEEYILNRMPKDGRKVFILRPCMIHGPGNKGNLNLLFKSQNRGLPWPLGAFENKRSLCSIDNILFVVQQLITENIEPGIYQVADDEALSTNELIRLMASSQNKKAKIWNIPSKPIKTIARLGDFFHLPLNSERLKKLTESYLVSNQKIKNALGIEKMPVSAVEGFKKTFEYFKKQL
ncbi:MAG: NAD-dependent epimerase/dehydratase family protein [Bacteroidia bacterium]|nr:NAD-dependent epimerase/dehydratase family protein [Bacteroidia bacterium]